MSALSYKPDETKAFVIAANPIYPLEPSVQSPDLIFEVLSQDAVKLVRLLGTFQTFYLDEVFTGRLETLDEVDPAHPTLQALARPTVRGRIRKFDGPNTVQ